MARFRATMQGQRGQASRLGNAKSGIKVKVNGWNLGVTVYGNVDDTGQDSFAIYQTGGSNDADPHKLITTIKKDCVG